MTTQSTQYPGTVNTDSRPRALSAIRLSVLTDETTSPERQADANDNAATAIGARIIGTATDLDVSASKTTPFERPELGEWLNDRADDFDVIIFWRLDRAVRSMADMSALVSWARKHGKRLVFAEGPGGSRLELDMTNVIGELIATLLAFAAQMEVQSIAERVTGAQAAMRLMALRWRGGSVPFGYRAVDLETGGKTLVQDKEAVKTIQRMIKWLKDGLSAARIAQDLNAEGTPSPYGKKWMGDTVKLVLTSESLIGWKLSGKKPVRDADGNPVMATAEPILTREEFDAVGAIFAERAKGERAERHDTNALLMRVIHCAYCGARMYQGPTSKGHVQYKCNPATRGAACPSPVGIKDEWADEYTTRRFLSAVGGLKLTKTRVIPGYDPQPEIDATTAEYTAHLEQQGNQQSKAAKAAWELRAAALDKRLAELEAREATPTRTEVVETGRTIAQAWKEGDTAARRALLQEAQIRVTVSRGKRGARKLDETRLTFEICNEWYASAADELASVA